MQPIVSPWYLYLMNACDMLHLAFMFSFGVCTLKASCILINERRG